jgi:hypothetical protein
MLEPTGTEWWRTQSPTPGQPGSATDPNYATGGATATSGGGGFDLSQFLQGLFGGGGGMPLGLSSLLPAILSGAHGLYNSGKYMENAERASKMASPVDQATRQRYQDRLNMLYTDPTAFLEGNPEFMANRKMGTAALNARNASRGNIGDGRATQDELTFLSDLGSRYINQERDDLMNMGGFQFNPAAGAEMLMRGGDQEIAARTAALGALAYPFGAGQGPGRGPGVGGSGAPGGAGQQVGQFLTDAIVRGGQSGWQAASQLLQQGVRFIQLPDGSTADLEAYMRMGAPTDNGAGFPQYPTGYPGTTTPPITGPGGFPLYDDEGYLMPEIDPGFNWESWLATLEDPNFDFSSWFDDSGGFDWTFGLG